MPGHLPAVILLEGGTEFDLQSLDVPETKPKVVLKTEPTPAAAAVVLPVSSEKPIPDTVTDGAENPKLKLDDGSVDADGPAQNSEPKTVNCEDKSVGKEEPAEVSKRRESERSNGSVKKKVKVSPFVRCLLQMRRHRNIISSVPTMNSSFTNVLGAWVLTRKRKRMRKKKRSRRRR